MARSARTSDGSSTGATTGAKIATASPTDAGLATLAVKLASYLKPAEKLYRWYLKRYRPDVFVLIEVAEEAKGLQRVDRHIERLWGSRWTRSDHEELEHLARCQPGDYLGLRQV